MTDLKEYGYQAEETTCPEGLIPGRVIAVHRELYRVICEYGEISAVMKGSFIHDAADSSDFPAIGDFVHIKYNALGNSGIVSVLPRKSKFSRTNFSGHAAEYVKTIHEQVVAANFDYVFIMSSLNQDFKTNRISRYLTAARQSGGIPVVILTKADLCEKLGQYLDEIKKIADDIDIVALSSYTGYGLEGLDKYLKPAKTVVFLGMSGVGKSSLINALAGKELMDVKGIREDDARGRHTTTHRQMLRLPSGVLVIDTPGMRELGLWDADEGISTAFPQIEDLISKCRFSDCRHKSEPGCAIQAALRDGSLPPGQWEGYLKQKSESAFVSRRSNASKKKRS